jgi:conjugative transfer signal peptidase TraF
MRPQTSRHVLIIMASALFFATLLVAAIAFKPMPLLIWNASDSVPVGVYFVRKRQPIIGEVAVIAPPDWVRIHAASRGYLPADVWLLKPVVATSGSVVCRFGFHIFINGNHVARAKIFDSKKRILPIWKGCRTLKVDEIFVLSKPKNSFDSRYFGPINREQVLGTAVPLFIP